MPVCWTAGPMTSSALGTQPLNQLYFQDGVIKRVRMVAVHAVMIAWIECRSDRFVVETLHHRSCRTSSLHVLC